MGKARSYQTWHAGHVRCRHYVSFKLELFVLDFRRCCMACRYLYTRVTDSYVMGGNQRSYPVLVMCDPSSSQPNSDPAYSSDSGGSNTPVQCSLPDGRYSTEVTSFLIS